VYPLAEFGVPEGMQLSVEVVWALLTGAGFVIVLGTGLLAWWLDRRVRKAARRAAAAEAGAPAGTAARAGRGRKGRRNRAAIPAPRRSQESIDGLRDLLIDLDRPPGNGRARRNGRSGGNGRNGRSGGNGRSAPPVELAEFIPADPAADPTAAGNGHHAAAGNGHHPATQNGHYPAVNGGDLAAANGRGAVRSAVADADTDAPNGKDYAGLRAAAARASTVAAQARLHSADATRELAAAEAAYDLARLGRTESDPSSPAEVTARQQYHLALAAAKAARSREFVADTAVRALAAEAAAAAAELAEQFDRIDGRRGRWFRRG
jgi:hypothetical protein